MRRKILIAAVVVSIDSLAVATAIPVGVVKTQEVAGIEGQVTGSLFLPMHDFLQAFPIGFSFCAEDIDKNWSVAMQPLSPGAKTTIESGCVIFNYVKLDGPLDVKISNGTDAYTFTISGVPSIRYAAQGLDWTPLVTDGEKFVTLTWDAADRRNAENGYLCSNRAMRLERIATKPFGTNEPLQDLSFENLDERCSLVPWTGRPSEGYWETFYSFADGATIRSVERFER